MPSWTELVSEFDKIPVPADKKSWIESYIQKYLNNISALLGGRHVIFYASSFLQKPSAPPASTSITAEDLNGFMAMVHGADCSKGLVLIMHTPGGILYATETLVSYLRSKYNNVIAIVPTLAMSAGTMICLSADEIIMGRQSQLGPIDPQMPINGINVSSVAIIDQFEKAKSDILADKNMIAVWAPILATYGPAILQEAINVKLYSEQIVTEWLAKYMFSSNRNPNADADVCAKHFSNPEPSATLKKNHGRRIDREEARSLKLNVRDLESSTELQDSVLSAYHLVSLLFLTSSSVKVMVSNHDKMWIKS